MTLPLPAPADRKDVFQAHVNAGMSKTAIGQLYGITRFVVYNYVAGRRGSGTRRTPSASTVERARRIVKYVKTGMALDEIALQAGVSVRTVNRLKVCIRKGNLLDEPRQVASPQLATLADLEWMVKGSCASMPLGEVDELFFDAQKAGRPRNGEVAETFAEAKNICRECPVRRQCLDYALRMEQGLGKVIRKGVYGGMDGEERFEEQQRRERQAVA